MPLIRIDFGIMEQVLYNLIYNSSQYAPPGSIIQINTLFINNKFIIEVFDNGPGFKETDLKNVFKKFFRADGSKTGGLGLGLSIVKGFVEAHNGNIIVKNKIDGGVKFALTIPSEIPEIKNL
jgi:signal transduction histidine kinase